VEQIEPEQFGKIDLGSEVGVDRSGGIGLSGICGNLPKSCVLTSPKTGRENRTPTGRPPSPLEINGLIRSTFRRFPRTAELVAVSNTLATKRPPSLYLLAEAFEDPTIFPAATRSGHITADKIGGFVSKLRQAGVTLNRRT
jgi:hypothetical protein